MYIGKRLVVIIASVTSTLYSCSTSQSITKSQLAGHWLTTTPATTSDIILDENWRYLVLLEDTTNSDTLHFTYKLRGKLMTIYYSP